MINVSIIGTGNIAYHFSNVFLKHHNINLIEVCGRRKNIPLYFSSRVNYCDDVSKISKSDIYMICVSDDQIEIISNKIKASSKSLILHCSGSTDMKALSNYCNYGVLYPLQTFSVEKNINFKKIPIIIEGNSKDSLNKIENLASKLSENVLKASSKQRLAIHVSAVFANNFTNYMRVVADEILKSNDIDPEILNPLTFETSDKLKYLNSKEAQTGPALRKDINTLKKHLNLLKGSSYHKIYETISNEIKKINYEL
jgi:predicted short-subunit dehydrogenase-like oxidoreductase (DUF2520 family)